MTSPQWPELCKGVGATFFIGFRFMVAEPAKVLAPAGQPGARWRGTLVTTMILMVMTSAGCQDDFLFDLEHMDYVDNMRRRSTR